MTKKIAISLPDEQLAAAREAVVRGEANSVSAYISEALRKQEHERGLVDLLDELDAELGPVTPDVQRWADSVFGLQT